MENLSATRNRKTTFMQRFVVIFKQSAPAVVGLITVVYSVISIVDARRKEQETRFNQYEQIQRAEEAMRTSEDVQAQMKAMNQALERMTAENMARNESELRSPKRPGSNKTAETQLERVQSEVADLRNEVHGFEVALGDDPAKKMGIVILRRDVDDLIESDKASIVELKKQMDSAREDAKSNLETVKWLLGAIGISNIVAPLAGALVGRKSDFAGTK